MLMVGLGQQHLAMPLGEDARVDHLDDLVGQVEQPHSVRDVGAAASNPLGQDDAGHAQVVEQDGERSGLLDRAEVLADDVLDQRELERPGLVKRVVDEGRDGRLAREFGGAPPALSRDQLIAILDRPDDDRLQDPALPDRVRQRRQRRLIEALARLSRIRPNLRDRDVAKPAGDLRDAGYRRGAAVVSRRQRIVDEQPSPEDAHRAAVPLSSSTTWP